MNRNLRVFAVVIAAVGVLVGFGFAAELVRSDFISSDLRANYVTLPLACGIATLACGAAIVWARPRSGVGWLLLAGGAGATLGFWRFSTHPWLAATGLVAFFATVLFPIDAALVEGIGIGPGARRVLLAGNVVVALLGVAIAVTAPPGALDRWFVAADSNRHVVNHFQLWSSRGVALGAHAAWWYGLLAVAAVGTASRVRRWHRAPVRVRRRETPVIVGTIAWLVLMAAAAGVMFVERRPVARQEVADYFAIAVPVDAMALVAATIAWVELVEPRLTRRRGSIEIRDIDRDRAELRSLLADLLASPRVDVAYTHGDAWVDARGVPIDVEADHRHHTVIEVNGDAVAVVLHERDVPVDAVQLAARITSAHIEAERATALARARAEAVRAATAELVRAGDRAAIAVAHEIESGPVPELRVLAERLRTGAATAAEAAEILRRVTAEVREVSHGIEPRSVEADGLAVVLGDRDATEGTVATIPAE